MNILVINSGSSSIKYQCIDMLTKRVIAKGLIERIGLENGKITHAFVNKKGYENTVKLEKTINKHQDGLQIIANLLIDAAFGVIESTKEILAVGHRVVHGGNRFAQTVKITPEVKKDIASLSALAPLHNPANLKGIQVAEEIFPKAFQAAVFDTAFYQNMPEKAHRYALPEVYYKEHQIRAYGFHGTSHKYVSKRVMEHQKISKSKIISLHLGNGASATAINNGVAVDTSMGFSPLDGLIMGTRTGAIDPTVIFYLSDKLGYSTEQITQILNKESGMLALSGYSDMRDVKQAYEKQDKNALLAYHMYAYRIKKYIGGFSAVLNGFDALIFTGGIGENDKLTRSLVCQDLDYLGLFLDETKNQNPLNGIYTIADASSKVEILVVPTDEEQQIANEVYAIMPK